MRRVASRVSDRPLAWPVKPTDHDTLATVGDACAYKLTLPVSVAEHNAWQHSATLALAIRKADQVSEAAIEELTRQLDLALFLSYRADLGAPRARPWRAGRPQQTGSVHALPPPVETTGAQVATPAAADPFARLAQINRGV